MNLAKPKKSDQRSTFADRLALAFFNAAIALPTGFLLWWILNGGPALWVGWLPVQSILWFSGAMAVVGAITHEVCLANFYGWFWRSVMRLFDRWWSP